MWCSASLAALQAARGGGQELVSVMNYCISSNLATKTSNFWYGILKSHFLQVGIIRKIIRRESEIRKFQRRWLPIFIEMSHIVKFNVTKFNSVDSVNC